MSLFTRADNPEFQSTEWEELQKKYGNIEETGLDRLAAAIQEEKDAIANMHRQQAAEKLEQFHDTAMEGECDGVDEDEARFMQEYRQRRIAEMQARAKAARFGAVLDISADSFRQDVTDSADGETCVVVHLFREGREDCALVDQLMRGLAAKHPHCKFTRIFFSNAIPNYPEANLPTILVYKDHDIALQLVTLAQLGGLEGLARGGEKLLQRALAKVGAVPAPPVEEEDEEGARGGAAEDSDAELSD